ncbi:MAG TPA: MATE family efflux transporter [Ignavibacteriaceae bacterium]|nr:MATE family efflux transporter [Ignavibacteriaceae bacterium]
MTVFPVNNYYKKILRVALPAIAGLSTQMVVSLVDTAMVGRLPEATYALAAMGLGVLATWALISFFSSLSTGTHVLVARKYGEGDYSGCAVVLNNSIYLSLVIGIAVAVVAVFAADYIARFFASDPVVGKYAGEYIFYRFLGIPAFLISVSYRGFYFGINKTKIFMFAGIITNLLNIIFNFLLIYGMFGFPRMGVAGSALGSTLATLFDLLFYLFVLLLPSYRDKFNNLSNLKINFGLIKKIYKISIPVSFQNVFILVGFLIFIAITGMIGTEQQAATQTIMSTLFISLLPGFGFGIAAQTLVGNNLGSGKIKLAKIYGYETAKVATYYALLLAVGYIIFPKAVLTIITTDDKLLNIAIPALRVAGFAQIFYATGVVLGNGLQSGGKTLFVMLSEVITNLLVFVPLAYFLGVYLNLGLTWAWGALPVYIILYSSIILFRFKFTRWW